MKKALTILILLLTFFVSQIVYAQHDPDLKYKKFRVSFFPPLSTNGVDAPNYSAKYSINILAGYNGALEGYEIGVININRYYAEGLQLGVLNGTGGDMAGLNFGSLANYAHGDMQGLQFAGLGNIAEGSVQGLQFSGLVNAGLDGIQGLQFAGIANVAGYEIQGLQFAGIANVAKGDIQGLQFAGIANAGSGDVQGIMMAGIGNFSAGYLQGIHMAGILNIAQSIEGIQIAGIVNIAQRGEGIQIGLVNTAEYFEGVPIGLISLYGNGRKNIDIWTSDGGFTNFGLKLGTMEIYNMISVGYNTVLNDKDLWSFGWSIGSHKPLEDAWNNDRYDGYFRMKDFTIQSIQENEDDIWESSMYKFRYLLGKELTRGVGFYAGPTLNLLVTDKEDERDFTWYSIVDTYRGGNNYKLWIGFAAGIQFF